MSIGIILKSFVMLTSLEVVFSENRLIHVLVCNLQTSYVDFS